MIVICAAYHREVQCLIEDLSLKQLASSYAKQIFEGEGIRVVISGSGAINAAIATTLAISTVEYKEAVIAINFGICGAQNQFSIGDIFHVNSVYAPSVKRTFYPEMILDLGLPQATLETREFPYLEAQSPSLTADLVDMEASGFFESARTFIAPSRIFIIKSVSDHGQSYVDAKSQMNALCKTFLPTLRVIIEKVSSWNKKNVLYTEDVLKPLAALRTYARFTETQYHRILFLCRARATVSDCSVILKSFIGRQAANRQERTALFREVEDALALSII